MRWTCCLSLVLALALCGLASSARAQTTTYGWPPHNLPALCTVANPSPQPGRAQCVETFPPGIRSNLSTNTGTACTIAASGTGCANNPAGDCAQMIRFTASSLGKITVPNDTSSADIGCEMVLEQDGGTSGTPGFYIVPASGATLKSAHNYNAPYGLNAQISLVLSAPGVWTLGGDGALYSQTPAIDGTPVSVTTTSFSLTTTSAPDLICISGFVNGAASFSPSSSAHVTNWAKITGDGTGATQLWCGTTTVALSSESITLANAPTQAYAFGISGVHIGATASASFDPDGAGTTTTGGSPAQVSTSNARDMILAGYQLAQTTDTAGSGFTLIGSASNFSLTEWENVTTAQSSLSVPISNNPDIDRGWAIGILAGP